MLMVIMGIILVPVVNTDLSHLRIIGMQSVNCEKDTLWIDGGWHTIPNKDGNAINSTCIKNSSIIEYAEVDSCNLSTFYDPCKELSLSGNPTPYATTMLLSFNEYNVSGRINFVENYSIFSFYPNCTAPKRLLVHAQQP